MTEAEPEKPANGKWVMSIRKVGPPGTEFHVYIGAVKIAEIAFNSKAPKFKCYMRFFGFEMKDYLSMSDALKDLHRLLKSPPPPGANVGNERQKEEASDAD